MSRLDELRAATRLFIDTDCLLKLAASGLWEPFLTAIGVAREVLRVGDETSLKLSDRRFQQKLSPAGYRRAVSAEAKIARLESFSQSDFVLLASVIDSGEAMLLAACDGHEKFYLLSADKKWPNHLWNEDNSALEPIKQRTWQRCLCFEQILLFLCENEEEIVPFAQILTNLHVIDDCWQTVGHYFRAGLATPKADAIQALESEIQRIRNNSGVLLMPNLPRLPS